MRTKNSVHSAARRDGIRSWGEIKAAVAKAGVLDDDLVFYIDIGPSTKGIFVERDLHGFVEIADDPALLTAIHNGVKSPKKDGQPRKPAKQAAWRY